jgi:hypothetical protein
VALGLLALAGLLVLGFFAWHASVPGQTEATPAATTPPEVKPVETSRSPLEKLRGRWLRPDGGYVLELRPAGSAGKLEVAYFNPRPIYVSRAEVVEEAAAVKVFVELQDVGYPGCHYLLTYDAPADRLKGTYYQAAMQQSFDVVFERLP